MADGRQSFAVDGMRRLLSSYHSCLHMPCSGFASRKSQAARPPGSKAVAWNLFCSCNGCCRFERYAEGQTMK